MAFCALLLAGLLLTCECLKEESRGYYWNHIPPASAGQNNNTIRTSQMNHTERHQDQGIKNQTTQAITDELKKIRWPQWPPDTDLNAFAEFTLRNNTSIMNQMQTNHNQNISTSQTIQHNASTHVNSTEDMSDLYDDDTISIQQRPIAGGENLSTKNWGLAGGISDSIEGHQMTGGDKLTVPNAPILQWHVGVYSKAFEPYMQICGGTLVTTKAVISAAHCFWNDLPPSRYIIAGGKLYRPWNDSHDLYAQKSEISAVHLPPRFRGADTSFQDDIAVVLLVTAFTSSPALRPLCVLFDEDLENTHLRSGKEGVILGWGLTAENGPPAQALQYLYMPYVAIEECLASVEPSFLKYITSDKICAGVTTGKALCRGDSGGGLVFFDQSTSERVPILFGVASTAPRNQHLCNTHARAALTRVAAHRAFLRAQIPDIEEACAKNYVSFASDTTTDLLEDRTAATPDACPQPVKAKLVCNCYCNNSTKH